MYAVNKDLALLFGRVAISLLMLVHGLPKLQALFSGDPVQFPAVFGLSAGLSLALAVFAEVICSLLVLVGFATRIAVVSLIVTMFTAAFYIHVSDPFSRQEPAILYLVVYTILLFAGAGKYSLGNFLQRQASPGYAARTSQQS